MKKIIIIGASSGIGRRVAVDFARMGWRVGIAARREDRLREVKEQYPDRIEYLAFDVAAPDAQERFYELIELIDGMDYLLYSAGAGSFNPELDTASDMRTLSANVVGFTRIINAAYRYYRDTANRTAGHIAVITSVAGVKGMAQMASYSASKRYQWAYLQAIDQLAHQQHVNLTVTDIRPGFVDTELLGTDRHFPMEMSVAYAAPRIEKAMLKHRRIAIVDSRWAVVAALWRMLPARLWRHLQINF